jgi:hypothetical protein
MDLIDPISKYEIFEAIWCLELDKAPGPNGFSISFYRYLWSLIKYDLKHILCYFQQTLRFGGNTIFSFISLIPKETIHTSFSRLWPISLCNSSYKSLTKIIVF